MTQLSTNRESNFSGSSLSEEQLREKLRGIIQITDQMLEHARNADWDMVESLEITRKSDIVLCFNKIKAVSSLELRNALIEVIAQDNKLLALVKEAREKAKFKKLNMNKSIVNVGQYTQASTL